RLHRVDRPRCTSYDPRRNTLAGVLLAVATRDKRRRPGRSIVSIVTRSSCAFARAARSFIGSRLDRVRRHRPILPTVSALIAFGTPAFAATYRYVDWTSADPAQGTASGTLTLQDGSVVNVTFKALKDDGSPGQLYGAQTSGGTNYWTPASTYTGAEVS